MKKIEWEWKSSFKSLRFVWFYTCSVACGFTLWFFLVKKLSLLESFLLATDKYVDTTIYIFYAIGIIGLFVISFTIPIGLIEYLTITKPHQRKLDKAKEEIKKQMKEYQELIYTNERKRHENGKSSSINN